METQSNLEQARRFLSRNAARLALRVVPLALVALTVVKAVPARATTFTSVEGGVFALNGGTISGSGNVGGSLEDAQTRLVLFANNVSLTTSGKNGLTFVWSGGGSGIFNSSTLPIIWDFTITGPGDAAADWELGVNIVTPNCAVSVSVGASICANSIIETDFGGSVPSGGGSVTSGPGYFIDVPLGQEFESWQVTFSVTANFGDGNSTMTVDIPGKASIEILPSAVPEPATLAIVGIGMAAGLLFARFRRRT